MRNACLLLFLLTLSTACVREVIVEKPVPVEVPGETVIQPVPADLLIRRQKATLPESVNYGELLQLCAEDRGSLDSCNGQIEAIESLGSE